MAKEPKKLTERQQRFAEAFAVTGNATEAARTAGYKHPHSQGSRLLKYVGISKAIAALGSFRKANAIADRDERQERLTAILRDMGELARDRLRAIEILGRCQGDFLAEIQPKATSDVIELHFYNKPEEESDGEG